MARPGVGHPVSYLMKTISLFSPLGVPVLFLATGGLMVWTQAATTYSDAVMADHPVFYWNFDQSEVGAGIAQMADAPAVTADNDLQALGTAGRVTHAATGGGLRLGSAAALDGAGYFRAAGALRAGRSQLTDAYAIEMWFRSTSTNSSTYLCNFGSIPGGDNSPAVIYNFQGPVLELFGGGRTGSLGPVMEDGNWHHFLAVYYGNGLDGVAPRTDLYLDGVSSTGLDSISRRLSLDGLIAGAGLPDPIANGFTGNIDELAVYDLGQLNLADETAVETWATSLNSRHRSSAMAVSGPGYSSVVKADSPLLYWNFDETDPAAPAVQQMLLTGSAGANELVPDGVPVLITHENAQSGLLLGSCAEVGNGNFFHARPLSPVSGLTQLAGPYMVEFWFQSLGGDSPAYFLNFGDYTAQRDNSPAVIYNFDVAPLHLELFSRNGQRTGLGGPTLSNENPEWHHLVIASYGGNGAGVADRLDFYLDQQPYPMLGPVVQPLSLGGLVAGAALLDGANNFYGRMDELAVYDLSRLTDEAAVTAEVSRMVKAHFLASGAAPAAATVTIGSQPESKSAAIGGTVTFSVSATASGTQTSLSYQWFRDNVLLPAEMAASLTTPPLTLADVGTHTYKVRVKADAAFADSVPAILTVAPPPALSPTPYSQQVIADGPVVYWNFDEATGPALQLIPLDTDPPEGANDLIPTANAVRKDHSASGSGLSLGYAASFAGNGHFKALLDTGLANLTGPFGVELWMRLDGDNPNVYLANFGDHTIAGGDNKPGLIYNFNPEYVEFYEGGTGRTGSDGPFFNDMDWHHLLFVYYGDGNSGVAPLMEIYRDGQISSMANFSAYQLSLAGVLVGAALPNGANSFTGQLDELAVYDFADAADENLLRARVEGLVSSHLLASTGPPSLSPALNVSVSGSTVTLTWMSGVGVALQESPDLTTWVTIPDAVSPYNQTVSADGRKFFRLARP